MSRNHLPSWERAYLLGLAEVIAQEVDQDLGEQLRAFVEEGAGLAGFAQRLRELGRHAQAARIERIERMQKGV
ncbi:MAG TPA: hypothetical protein VNK04_01205 [Gemmataceae bacterium]|nr:hypothetical protein [Gemmataceae bacterium]